MLELLSCASMHVGCCFSKAFLKLQMLGALRNSPDSMNMSSMKDYIDPNMMDLYPHDCLFKVIYNHLLIFFIVCLLQMFDFIYYYLP